MSNATTSQWKIRSLIAGVLPLVVFFQLLSMNTMAQTTTNSKGFLAGRVSARSGDVKVAFTYGPKYPKVGQAVQFLDASTGSPNSWAWDFGDGETSAARNPSHNFSTPGFRRVTLIASNNAGSRKSIKSIMIMPDAAASFVFSPMTPGPGQPVQFADTSSGDPTFWLWDFGDGVTSTLKNPGHIFLRAGFYTTTLISSNSSGSKQASKTVTVASVSMLSSSFNYMPAFPSVGQTVQFTDASAGTPTSWQWNFGDGGTSTSQNPSHSYTTAGSKTVTMTATSASGSNSSTKTVTVAAALAASFTNSPASPAAGQAVQFTDASAGTPTSWQWNFGDGSTSVAQNPYHTYSSAGTYTITLTIMNASGQANTSKTATVTTNVPVASFAYDPASPVANQPINLTDTSTGSPASWYWDFNDGSTSTAQNPNHTYTAAGTYNVSLTVANDTGSTSTSLTISVGLVEAITAASASLADVSAAIAKAKPGDTVMVPAGSATWVTGTDGGILNFQSNLIITRGINLIGAGIGLTNITFSASYGITYAPSAAACAADDSFRVSGFTFDHSGHATWGSNGAAICLYGRYFTNALKRNRLDHLRFYKDGGTALEVRGPIWGVGDHCQFDYTNNAYRTYLIVMRGTGGDRDMWDNFPASFGSDEYFYLEDCTSYGPIWFEGGQGGRYCVRHNVFDATSEFDVFDMHGNQPGTGNYATMIAEVYDNVFTNVTKSVRLAAIRGGKVLVYNNSVDGVAQVSGSVLNSYEENPDYLSPVNDSSISIQHPNNCYLFNNIKNGAKFTDVSITGTVDYSVVGEPYRVVPQKDKDIWWEQSSFNGSSGVGVGLLSARPSSGLSVGVGYWATDTKTLFRWTATKGWEEYYKPYTYPHPLRNN